MRFFSLITSLEKSLCLIYFLVWWVRCVCRYLINRYRWLIFHLTWNTSRVCYLVVFIFWLWISLAFGIWTISFCLGQFDPGRGQSDFEMDMDMLVCFGVEVTAPPDDSIIPETFIFPCGIQQVLVLFHYNIRMLLFSIILCIRNYILKCLWYVAEQNNGCKVQTSTGSYDLILQLSM